MRRQRPDLATPGLLMTTAIAVDSKNVYWAGGGARAAQQPASGVFEDPK
jgi:hypothetical protein